MLAIAVSDLTGTNVYTLVAQHVQIRNTASRNHYTRLLSPLIMSMEESISLEETNKIRISLGLKPLTEDKAPADDKEQQAGRNYAKHREAEARERETKYEIYQPSLCSD